MRNSKTQKTECGNIEGIQMEKDINEILQTRRLIYFGHDSHGKR